MGVKERGTSTGCRGRWTSSSPRPWCRTLKRSSTPGSPHGARRVGFAGRSGHSEEIWEQMSLLFGELSKEELLRQVVLTELRKLDTGTKADLNQSAMESPSAIGATKTDEASALPQEALQKALQEQGHHGAGASTPQWEDSKPGSPWGGQGQEEAQEKGGFKPGGEAPWQGKSSGAPVLG